MPNIAGHQGQAVRYEKSHHKRPVEQGLSLRNSPLQVNGGREAHKRAIRDMKENQMWCHGNQDS